MSLSTVRNASWLIIPSKKQRNKQTQTANNNSKNQKNKTTLQALNPVYSMQKLASV